MDPRCSWHTFDKKTMKIYKMICDVDIQHKIKDQNHIFCMLNQSHYNQEIQRLLYPFPATLSIHIGRSHGKKAWTAYLLIIY